MFIWRLKNNTYLQTSRNLNVLSRYSKVFYDDRSLALKQTHQSHRIQDVNPFLLKFKISILLTVWHKFVCSIILVLSMRIWCNINVNVLKYRKSHSLSGQGFQSVGRAPSPVPPGGFMQGVLIKSKERY